MYIKSILLLCFVQSSLFASLFDTGGIVSESLKKDCSFYSVKSWIERRKERQCCYYNPWRVSDVFGWVLKDAFCINWNLLTWDSFKIVTTIFPFYISARMVDQKLQNCFFDFDCMKNKHCVPHWCKEVARVSVAPVIAFFGINAFLNRDDRLRTTSQVMLIGLPFVFYVAQLAKYWQCDASLRPWHEKFCKNGSRSNGGLPSGHTAKASYLAVLYGLEYGPKAAIPLGILTAFVGSAFVACNRHYLSQVVAGVGFGALYGAAAHKTVQKELEDLWSFDFYTDECARPGFCARYRF